MASPGELSDWLRAIAHKDTVAFASLYAATGAKLYGVVLRILRRPDLASQVMQDAYTRIWQSAGEFDPGLDAPITWMVGIARRCAIDLLRNRGQDASEKDGPLVENGSEEVGALDRQSLTEELRRLLACLGELEPDRRRLVLRAYYSGWSRDQLAEKFGAGLETVKAWLADCLLRIRRCLGP
jgi:RNA polymerase sigma-70 factor, ECF subfamily